MVTCPTCQRQYDERSSNAGRCMACQGQQVTKRDGALQDLPPHQVTEEGLDETGRRYIRVRYADGSDDFIPTEVTGQAFQVDRGGDQARNVSLPEAAERYRRAQVSRLLRYYRECGLTDAQIRAGGPEVDLSPIYGPDGTILPEAQDFEHQWT